MMSEIIPIKESKFILFNFRPRQIHRFKFLKFHQDAWTPYLNLRTTCLEIE